MTTSAFGVPHGAEDITKAFGFGSFKQVTEAVPHARKAIQAVGSGNWGKAAKSGSKALGALKTGATSGGGSNLKTASKWIKKKPIHAVGAAAAGGAAIGYGMH